MKKIGIIGCGWLGLRIAKHLSSQYQLITTNRSDREKAKLQALGFDSFVVDFSNEEISTSHIGWRSLGGLDCIIITLPFSARMEFRKVENRFRNVLQFLDGFDKQIILMSSIGIYPPAEQTINEDTFDDDQLNSPILRVEQLIRRHFSQVSVLRLGGLMGDDRILSNYAIKEPHQVVNHVHYADICHIVDRMIASEISGKIYNVVAPLHPTKLEIINYQQKRVVPSLTFKPFGRIIQSNRVQQDLAYEFIHPDPLKFAKNCLDHSL